MRRHPGDRLRSEIRKRNLDDLLASLRPVAVLFFLPGVLLGLSIQPWIAQMSPKHLSWASAVVSCITVLVVLWVWRSVRRRDPSADRMAKGLHAEKRVGQLIEFAVSHPGCAVAHNVKGIARYGDIDHLVMTPERIWVVETKSGTIPKKYFRKELSEIVANVRAVREKFPGEDVSGCLVLADEADYRGKRNKEPDHDSETIYVECPRTLVRRLRNEAGGFKPSGRAKRVWALGKVDG